MLNTKKLHKYDNYKEFKLFNHMQYLMLLKISTIQCINKCLFVIEVRRLHIFWIDLNLERRKKHVHYCNDVEFN